MKGIQEIRISKCKCVRNLTIFGGKMKGIQEVRISKCKCVRNLTMQHFLDILNDYWAATGPITE
jgi:hypothetical protein